MNIGESAVCEMLTFILYGSISSLCHATFSPIAYTDPLNCNMAGLFTELFKDALNEYAYDAELAGLSYDLMNTICGMVVSKSESVKYFSLLFTILWERLLGIVNKNT